MSKNSETAGKLLLGVISLVAGLMVGLVVGDRRSLGRPAISSPTPRLTELDPPSRPAAEPVELAATTTNANTPTPPIWQVLTELKQQGLVELSPEASPVDATGKLKAWFLRAFEVSSAETHALQNTLDDARRRISELQEKHAKVTRFDRGAPGVTINIDPFPAAGGSIHDNVMQTFARVLGPERYKAFLGLGSDRLDAAFAHFGAEERSMTFFYGPEWMNGPYISTGVVKQGDQQKEYAENYRTKREIEERLGHIASLLPIDFGAEDSAAK